MVRIVFGALAILFASAAMAAPLPSDGNAVPPHSSSGDQGQGDTQPSGDGSGLPSDGNVVPPHGGSDQQSGGSSGSQLPSDGNVVPHGDGHSQAQSQDHSI